MKSYLVGGAVRDKLLNYPANDRDWVVVGATTEEMEALGYRLVGNDFPVFLHPQSHEEYALARTERKSAHGYKGFSVSAAPDVTLEQDLLRRDLTINAIAEDENGQLIDPFNGQSDIKNKIFRHVSAAFTEDPLRVLRVARYMARFAHLGFRIADETMALMKEIVVQGEIEHLVAERSWQETERALAEKNPQRYFEVLRECGALKVLLPEIDRLFGVPQTAIYHPEIDTGVHTMMVLEQAALLSTDTAVRFAALVHDLGKGTTAKNEWPKHIAHEERGVPLVQALCKRLKTPNPFRDLAVAVTRYHLHYHRAAELRDDTFLSTLEKLDAFRRPDRFEQFLLACEADSRGRSGFEDAEFDQPTIYRLAFAAAQKVSAQAFVEQGLEGPEIAEAMRKSRIEVIRSVRQPYTQKH
ncbi:MAG: multifunctional CCA addition/repair protein [Gammaproteobacteria bacterium]|nr:multifunctional CCA addition/repair protein [Gammaproteobacteria bacterium]